MDTEVEDHQAHTDRHQWVAMAEEGAVDAHPHRAEDGEGGVEAEGGEDVAEVTLVTGLVRTRDPEVGVREGVCHDHRTAGHPHEHHRAGVAVEVAMAGGTRHLEEEEGTGPLEEGAPATTRTTAHGPGVGAEIAGKSLISYPIYPIMRRCSGSCSIISFLGLCTVTVTEFDRLHLS